MILDTISLHQFRSYPERSFQFNDGVTMFVGPNGAGKTNVLEAIYTLLVGKSFRDSDDALTTHDAQWWKLTGVIDNHNREIRFRADQRPAKQLLVDGVVKGRFTYKHRLPVVLFEPDDLFMLHAAPSARRDFLDSLLEKIDPSYPQARAKYERALLQRNSLLKKGLPLNVLRDAVFVWDVALAEYGARLYQKRRDVVDVLNQTISERYSQLAGRHHKVAVLYRPSVSDVVMLTKKLAEDVQRGSTSLGPHRDDVEFILEGKSVKLTASRGEIRTILLALKQCEVDMIVHATSQKPLLLLDDVFSELDAKRVQQVAEQNKLIQTIITSASKPTFSFGKLIHIKR